MQETTVKQVKQTLKVIDRKKATVIHMGVAYRKVYSYRIKKEDHHERAN